MIKHIFLGLTLLLFTQTAQADQRIVVKNNRGQVTQQWRVQGNRATITDRNGRITGYARLNGNTVTTYDRNGRRK